MHYGLARNVYLADVDGDLVLLDARRNRYFCIARDAAEAVRSDLTGHNRFRGCAPLIDDLEAEGLYGIRDPAALPRQPERTARADIFLEDLPHLRRPDIPLLATAMVRARWELRSRRPDLWLAAAMRRRQRDRTGRDPEGVASLGRRAFIAQPLFPGAAHCLTNSLWLLHWLHLHGMSADWVFGVRTFPFEAHCWVEFEGMVLNDSLDHVRWYTPILAV